MNTSNVEVIAQRSAQARVRENHKLWHLSPMWLWLALDVFIASVSMLTAFHVTPSSGVLTRNWPHIEVSHACLVFAVSAGLMGMLMGLNHLPNMSSRIKIVVMLVVCSGLAILMTTLVVSLVYYRQIGRYIVVSAVTAFFLIEAGVRLLWYNRVRMAEHRVALIGPLKTRESMRSLISGAPFPVLIVSEWDSAADFMNEFRRAAQNIRLHEIVIAPHVDQPGSGLLDLLANGLAVTTIDVFVERHLFKIPVSYIGSEWFYRIDLKQHHPVYSMIKRVFDIAISLVLTILVLPLLLIAGLLIKLESRGPVLYSQMRVGRGGQVFRLWKLRSMCVDAERSGPQWAKRGDARVTRIGRLLRLTRIDELPQLWNILGGQMAFVGPRPERPEFVAQLNSAISYYGQRHAVKPGLTGWAQISYQYGASVEDACEKLSFDLYYIKNASLLLDLQIIMRTVGAVARGAR